MNEAEEDRVKKIAHKIEIQATDIVESMQALQRNRLLDMPTSLIEVNFCQAIHGYTAIARILREEGIIE